MIRQTYTYYAVKRENTEGYGMLCIRVEFDDRKDIMAIVVDGGRTEFHRRGRPTFATWTEGIKYIRSQGWPVVDGANKPLCTPKY